MKWEPLYDTKLFQCECVCPKSTEWQLFFFHWLGDEKNTESNRIQPCSGMNTMENTFAWIEIYYSPHFEMASKINRLKQLFNIRTDGEKNYDTLARFKKKN